MKLLVFAGKLLSDTTHWVETSPGDGEMQLYVAETS
jgi:hypothetical protein